jgi:hypothetical protein
MVIYFFTLIGFRLSKLLGNSLFRSIEIVYKFIFRDWISSFNFEEHNFYTEFNLTCAMTSSVAFYQLASSVKSFHTDLQRLHKGQKFFANSAHSKQGIYSTKKREESEISSEIASDSLHYPGYLVAHLIYGYVLLFLIFFGLVVLSKFFLLFPNIFFGTSQVLFPLILMVFLKLIIIKFMTKTVFLPDDNQRITNLTPYFTIAYFNFFFDCFLGLMACMSRVWQTTIVSLITLPRLDKSMFNQDRDMILLRRLDKGHLSYINFVRMEHWYNNPVLNGFCEMLIESMLFSQIYKGKFEVSAKSELLINVSQAQNDLDDDEDDGTKPLQIIKSIQHILPHSNHSVTFKSSNYN